MRCEGSLPRRDVRRTAGRDLGRSSGVVEGADDGSGVWQSPKASTCADPRTCDCVVSKASGKEGASSVRSFFFSSPSLAAQSTSTIRNAVRLTARRSGHASTGNAPEPKFKCSSIDHRSAGFVRFAEKPRYGLAWVDSRRRVAALGASDE